jgi:phosphatidylinositol 3-kinase
LEGSREKKSVQAILDDPQLQFSGLHQSDYSDLYVVCQIFANGHPLTLPAQTAYKPFSTRWNWNEWVTLPMHFKDMPSNAILALTIYDIYGPQEAIPVGGTTVSIFGKHGCVRHGIRDLRVWSNVEADGSVRSSTPGEGERASEGHSEMRRLSKLVQKHKKGRMLTVDWLDRLTFREIEVINEREKRASSYMYLTVEFPKFHYEGFEHSVVYFEPDGDLRETLLPKSAYRLILDPEWNMENLVELKHHRLTHSLREGMNARDLKPNAKLRDHIASIVNLPPTHVLSADEKSLIWQFRYYLGQNKAALPKFLQSVSWQSKQEVEEALDLLSKWQPLDPADALELLSPNFKEPKVRAYAISRLQCAENEELLLYLLQLVQALRYEEPEFLSVQEVKTPPPSLSLGETYSEGRSVIGYDMPS